MRHLKEVVEKGERRLHEAMNEIVQLQSQYSDVQHRYSQMQLEAREYSRQVAVLEQELQVASEDLGLMTRENQVLTSELADACGESETLRSHLMHLRERVAALEMEHKAVYVEKEDLLQAYRSLIQERRRLQKDLELMSESKQKGSITTKQQSDEISELRGMVDYHNHAESRRMSEKLSFSKQLETLNDQLVNAKQKLEGVEADNRRSLQVLFKH